MTDLRNMPHLCRIHLERASKIYHEPISMVEKKTKFDQMLREVDGCAECAKYWVRYVSSSDLQATRLLNRRVMIDIDEPSSYAFEGTNERAGRIVRIFAVFGGDGLRYHLAIVELDEPLLWAESSFRVVSLMSRFARWDILDLGKDEHVGVNINGEPEWLVDSSEDDRRVRSGRGSRYLGFGTAWLLPES